MPRLRSSVVARVDINQLVISLPDNRTASQSHPGFHRARRTVHAKRGNNSSISHLRSNLVRNSESCPEISAIVDLLVAPKERVEIFINVVAENPLRHHHNGI